MDRKRKRWTEEEDLVVVSLMREHSGDVCKVAELASRELGRTPMAISCRWYAKLRPGKRVTGGGRDSKTGRKGSFICRLIKFIFRR